jgi:hypothetical protein
LFFSVSKCELIKDSASEKESSSYTNPTVENTTCIPMKPVAGMQTESEDTKNPQAPFWHAPWLNGCMQDIVPKIF